MDTLKNNNNGGGSIDNITGVGKKNKKTAKKWGGDTLNDGLIYTLICICIDHIT